MLRVYLIDGSGKLLILYYCNIEGSRKKLEFNKIGGLVAFVTSLVMTSGFGDQLGGLVTSF